MASKFLSAMDNYFAIKQHGSRFRTEVMAGFTTFIAMVYIIFVNSDILAAAGIPKEAAIAATIYSAAIFSILMGIYAKVPLALAPSMGANIFFTFYICHQLHATWQVALGLIFLSGVICVVIAFTSLQAYIIKSVPKSMKYAITVGIGLFFAFIGLQNAGIVVNSDATLVKLGDFSDPKLLVTIVGILASAAMVALGFKAALISGIIITTVLAMIFNISPVPSKVSDFVSLDTPSLAMVFFEMDLIGALKLSYISVIMGLTVLCLFDNIGTIIAVSQAAKLIDDKGNMPHFKKSLQVATVGSMCSGALGTSSVTSYIESITGVQAGGRTGLTAVVVGILFFLALFFSPLVGFVPTFATTPVLLIVGSMMIAGIKNIDFDDWTETFPAFLTLFFMPLSYSIMHGFAVGFSSYCFLKLLTGRFREISPVMWILTIIFVYIFKENF